MAWALIASVSGRSTDGNGFTTGSIDTSGANFLIFGAANYNIGSFGMSDSKGNTWTPLTIYNDSGVGQFRFYYVENPTVGSGHTFSTNGFGTYPSICVGAFSGGAAASSFDLESGLGAASPTTTIGSTSVTPSVNNELVVVGLQYNDTAAVSIDSGFTKIENQLYTVGQSSGSALAYIIETTATAKAPTWTLGTASAGVSVLATFKAAAGGVVFIAKSIQINQSIKRASYF